MFVPDRGTDCAAEVGLLYARVALYFGWRPLSQNRSLVHDCDAVRQLQNYIDIVFDQQEGDVTRYLAQLFNNFMRSCKGHPRGRFIKKN